MANKKKRFAVNEIICLTFFCYLNGNIINVV